MIPRTTFKTTNDGPRQRLEAILQRMGVAPTLRGVRIICCDITPTGCWLERSSGAVEIRINEDLAKEATDEELEALIAHEIFHHVGYHNARRLTTVCRVLPSIVNIVFDIAINTLLTKRVGLGRGLAMLFDRLAGHLLEPKGQLRPESAICMLSHPSPPLDRMPTHFQAAWRQLWEGSHAPSPEMCFTVMSELLMNECASSANHCTNSVPNFLPAYYGDMSLDDILSNSYITRGWPPLKAVAKDFNMGTEPTEQLAEFVENRTGGTQASDDWIRVEDESRPRRTKSRSSFENDLSAAYCQEVLFRAAGDLIRSQKTKIRLLPYCLRPTSRAIVNSAIGIPKLHFANREHRRYNALPVYIDVSGSMADVMPLVQGLIKELRHVLPSRVFLFDRQVREQPVGEALTGLRFYGGGTDFNVFVSHALDRRYRDALVITDGAGSFHDSSVARIRAHGLRLRAMILSEGAPHVRDDTAWYRMTDVHAHVEHTECESKTDSRNRFRPRP